MPSFNQPADTATYKYDTSTPQQQPQGTRTPPNPQSLTDTQIPQDGPSKTTMDSTSTDSKTPLPLPEPSSPDTTKIDMSTGGCTVKLDHLGPLVVNKDGTLSRIANWESMAEVERENTLRILGKRNMLRREALQKAEDEDGKQD
jgi:hypothetical protein